MLDILLQQSVTTHVETHTAHIMKIELNKVAKEEIADIARRHFDDRLLGQADFGGDIFAALEAAYIAGMVDHMKQG